MDDVVVVNERGARGDKCSRPHIAIRLVQQARRRYVQLMMGANVTVVFRSATFVRDHFFFDDYACTLTSDFRADDAVARTEIYLYRRNCALFVNIAKLCILVGENVSF